MRYRLNYPENFSEKNPESRQVGMRSSNNDNFFLQLFIITIIFIITSFLRTF